MAFSHTQLPSSAGSGFAWGAMLKTAVSKTQRLSTIARGSQLRWNSSWHQTAKAGFTVGTEQYNKFRPTYPSEPIAQIREAVNAPPPLNVAELGSGSGIFTRNLLAHPAWAESIGRLRAVEPSEGMRQSFDKSIQDPRVVTTDGTFDITGVPDGWADVVIVAQAFHWATNFDAAVTEFARILKPNAPLALIWNMEDRSRAAWLKQCRERIEQYENNSPHFRFGLWRKAFDVPSWDKYFTRPVEKVHEYHHPGTMERLVNRSVTKSDVAPLPDDEKKKIQKDIASYIQKGDGMVWIDKEKGIFEYPHQVTLVLAHRKD